MGATEAVRAPERDPTELAAPPVPEGGEHMEELGHTRRLCSGSALRIVMSLSGRSAPICAWGEKLSGGLSRSGRTPGALPSVPCPSLGKRGQPTALTPLFSVSVQLSEVEADRLGRAWGCPSLPPPCTHWTLP